MTDSIWVIKKGSAVLGAFTIKYKMVDWLGKNALKYGWQNYEISIVRCSENNPTVQQKYYSMDELLNG